MIDAARFGPWALIAGGSEGVGAEFAGLEVGLLILNAGANTHSREFLDGHLAEFQKSSI